MDDGDDGAPVPRGFVYAATGEGYTALALKSAETLRRAVSGAVIDLFTDQALDAASTPFDRVHAVEPWFRPKFRAMIESRFERSFYLDADTMVVADPSDAFALLDRFDVAIAHEAFRGSDHATQVWRDPVPAAYPQFNSGVMVARRTPSLRAVWQETIDAIRTGELAQDQVVLRELLYASDLRVAVLPQEYNLMDLRQLNVLSSDDAAPRILHSPRLHATFRKGKRPVERVSDLIGRPAAAQLTRLLASDRTLGGTPRKVRSLYRQGPLGLLHTATTLVRGRFSN